MADDNDLNSLLSQLQQLKNSKDYLNISNTLDRRFHSQISDLIKKWMSYDILSSEEKEFFDLYSNLQLSFVEYCFFNSDTTENVQTMISKFPANLFNIKQTKPLAEAVAFIRDEYMNNNNDDDQKNDLILVYIMRMLDARSFAYRLCFKDLRLRPTNLNDELRECLTHRHAKRYLYDIKSVNKTDKNIFINDCHKFFIGCCSYAIALFDENKGMLKDDDQKKYIYLLVKYVRIMLSQNNFEQDKSILYCLRGVFALLTNCVPTDNWINIINKALANEDDDNAQQANPFNIDLFSLIINRLLGSIYLRDKAIQSDSHVATSLVDIALIFLNKWFDTSSDLSNDDEDDNQNNYKSILTNVPNQVLRLLRSDTQLGGNLSPSRIIIPYIDATYDRLRLMAISTLSSIMSNKDFKDLQDEKVNMGKDIVKLIFHFIDRAIAQDNQQYKGISFERLLCFLLRFLVQDSIKKETLPYISQIINYAKNSHLYALKILRKMSTSPDIQKLLLKNTDLERFLKREADNLYKINPKWYKYIENIRQNLAPPKPMEPISKKYNLFKKMSIFCLLSSEQC